MLVNVSGGRRSATSLAELSAWCARRFGPREVSASAESRPFDLPWIVLDHTKATDLYGWRPEKDAATIFEEIAAHGERHPDWLELSHD
jgi:CDP-paratose 2-epimerase